MTLDMPSLFSLFKDSKVNGEGLGSDSSMMVINDTRGIVTLGMVNGLMGGLKGTISGRGSVTNVEYSTNHDLDTFTEINLVGAGWGAVTTNKIIWDLGNEFILNNIRYTIDRTTENYGGTGSAGWKIYYSTNGTDWTQCKSASYVGNGSENYTNHELVYIDNVRYIKFESYVDLPATGGYRNNVFVSEIEVKI